MDNVFDAVIGIALQGAQNGQKNRDAQIKKAVQLASKALQGKATFVDDMQLEQICDDLGIDEEQLGLEIASELSNQNYGG